MKVQRETNNSEDSKTALRPRSTKGMSRDEWLLMHKQGIGSIDAATAIGFSRYQSPLEPWMVKTGRNDLLPKIDPNATVFSEGRQSARKALEVAA